MTITAPNKSTNQNTMSLPDPISVLMQEHQLAIRHLLKLEHAIASMNSNGFTRDAFEHLGEAIRFFDSDFRKHDKKEEQFLFPSLEKHEPGITSDYRNEHRELWGTFTQLLSCVQDVEDGRLRGSSRQELVQTAKRIVDLLRAHIINENTFLFSKAKLLLTQEEYYRLSENIAAAVKE